MGKAFDSVDGNMDILMYNNTVKKIKDVRKGDTVFSVRYDGEAYQYVKGEVTSINKRKGKAVKITLNDGRGLICSPNHQWLTNMGWMFSYDDETLIGGKFFLTENTKMTGLTGMIKNVYTESKRYMEGYILGTEIFGKNLVRFKGGDIAEFVLQEAEVTLRMYNYFLYFGADVTIEDCFAHDKDTNEHYVTKKLNIPYKQLITLSERFSKNREKEEFMRGFVAGVYDSAVTVNPTVKYINNSKKIYLDILKKCFETFDFEYSYDSREMTASLLGGPSELLRFYTIFSPVTTCKVENVPIMDLHHDRLRVVSIEEVKCDDLVEVTTNTRNFIANGIISHNCTTGLAKEV
jgi:hypothetical protein